MLDREIVLAVTGGIAAYKSAMLASLLVQAGAKVTAVMSHAATRFVGPATFAALTGRRVWLDAIDETHSPLGPHIDLAEGKDLLCVAPATANFLAKAAHGIADDLLGTLTLAFPGPIIAAPAMNTTMWEKPAVQRNLQRVRDDGMILVDPQEGWLSCRRRGIGRMAEPATIFAVIEKVLIAK